MDLVLRIQIGNLATLRPRRSLRLAEGLNYILTTMTYTPLKKASIEKIVSPADMLKINIKKL